MTGVISAISGFYGLIKGVFQFIDAGVQLLGDFVFHIKATKVDVFGEKAPRPIQKNERIDLPSGTGEITLLGTYCVKPPAGNYVVLVRKEDVYWPQGQIMFSRSVCGKWDAKVTFGSPGRHLVIVAKLSPDLMAVFDYYRALSMKLETYQAELKSVLTDEFKRLADRLPNWQGIHLPLDVAGLRNLQEIEVVVGKT